MKPLIAILVAAAVLLILIAIDDGSGLMATDSTAGGVSDPIESLSQAISQAEGFGVPGAFPTRNNNPGDLTDPSTGIKRVFGDAASGWNALASQLNLIATGGSGVYTLDDTFASFAQKWTGGDNVAGWLDTVTQQLGVTADTTLGQFFGQ